jgi:hypothetical protein
VSPIQHAKSYLKRITRRLLEITRDGNPGDRIRQKPEDTQKSEAEEEEEMISLFYIV